MRLLVNLEGNKKAPRREARCGATNHRNGWKLNMIILWQTVCCLSILIISKISTTISSIPTKWSRFGQGRKSPDKNKKSGKKIVREIK